MCDELTGHRQTSVGEFILLLQMYMSSDGSEPKFYKIYYSEIIKEDD